MKVSAQRADSVLARLDSAIRAVLLYGPDEGLVRERAATLLTHVVGATDDPFRLTTVTAAELAKDRTRLADDLAAVPMTGGRRAVRVRDGGDAVTEALRLALDRTGGDGLAVIEAGDLSPRSSLRKLCEASPAVAAVPCYVPDVDEMGRVARAALADAGFSLAPEAEAYLAENLVGDRQLARRELEKLAAFMGRPGRIELEHAQACIGDSAQQSLDDLVLAVADGDLAAVDRVLAKLFAEGAAPVSVLRAAQRHFDRLHLGTARLADGERIEQVMTGLRIFFKAQPRVRRQLGRWSVERAAGALRRLQDAEALCKRTGMPAETVCSRTLFEVASLNR